MHEKNIALLCDEADRLLQLNINLLRQMVEEPDVLSDSKNENRLLFDKQKALKRIEELEGEQIKTARREMVLAVVGTMKAGKSTTINAIVGQEILPNRNRPMTSVPTLIRHVPGKTEPVLHLEHIQPVRNLLITLQEKLATPAGQQVAQTLQQTGDTRELLDILTDDGWLKNEYHGEEEIFTGLASLNDLVRLAAAMGTEFPFDEYAEVQKLPVIDVEFSHLVGMDACQGTLTLLDTPGPNEAGQPQMEVMMRDQLQKASAVLAVMDYTRVNDRVSSLVSDTARLAHYSADTREQLLTLDHYLDTDALADGLPLYVSLYPTEGGMQDIIDCIRAELGVGTTKNAVFQHIQSLPRGQQKEALLASAALPLLFRPREVQGTMFGDGGMGGWRNMQGNTPVTPLVDAGCNMVIVTHLSEGSLWDRQAFPDTTILEIRPRKRLKYAGDGGNSGGLLSFTSAHTDAWRQQGYEDTMLAMEHIRKPLAARQALTRSEAVLQKSLDITEEADLALRNAMARIK